MTNGLSRYGTLNLGVPACWLREKTKDDGEVLNDQR
jgi:hypothetical protein